MWIRLGEEGDIDGWVQANVMLAYPIPEAEELLDNKLKTAQLSLSNCEEDLDFLREQITVRIPSRSRIMVTDLL